MPRRKKSSHENHSRSSLSINKDKPQQRYAANARERARMRVLSRAFCRLKTTLPWVPADTKLSKLDTLRLAASYIAHLKGILREESLGSSESSLHPAMSMTWPFGFNRPLGGSTGGGSQQGGSLEGSEDEDDDDGESISSCTWEDVPPPKECVHLDSRPNRARGKGNCSENPEINLRESSLKCTRLDTLHTSVISTRPGSQHHPYHTLHPVDKLSLQNSGVLTGLNLENLSNAQSTVAHHMESLVPTNSGDNESFVADMTSAYSHHHHHHHIQQSNEHHHIAAAVATSSSAPFTGYSSNDLISIG